MRGVVKYSLTSGAIRGFRNGFAALGLTAVIVATIGGGGTPVLWSKKASALASTNLTSTASNPSFADTCGWSSPFDVTSHVDAAGADYHKQVVVKVTADAANPAPTQVTWSGGAGNGTLDFSGDTAYYEPTGPGGFALNNNETASFQAKFSAAGTYTFTSQIVLAADHTTVIGSPLVQTTKVSSCYIYINEISSSSSPDWVELYGSANMDMSGWVVRFESGATSQSTTLSTGTHLDGGGYFVVNAPNASWLSPSGGTVTLLNAYGDVQKTVSYGSAFSGGAPVGGATATATSPGDTLSLIGTSTGLGWVVQKATPGKANDKLAAITFNGFPANAEVGVPQEYTATVTNYKSLNHKVVVRITLNHDTTKDDFTLEQKVGGTWQPVVFASNGLDIPTGGLTLPAQGLSVDFRITFNKVGTFGSSVELDDLTAGSVLDMNKLSTVVTAAPAMLTLPAAPTNVSWKTASGNVISDNGITNEYKGTATWQDGTPSGQTSNVDHYVYRYWNDITGNQWKAGHEWPSVAGLTVHGTSRSGEFTEGDGIHHFCVAAVDAAGNESSCTEFTVTYDTTSPSIGGIQVIAPGGNELTTAPRFNPWKVTTTDNSDVNGITDVYAYVYRQDGTNWTRLDPVVEIGTPKEHIHYFRQGSTNLDYWVSSKNAGNFQDGHTYRLVVWAKDAAGNESNHTDAQTVADSSVDSDYFSPAFTIDNTAPVVVIDGYSAAANIITPSATATDSNAPLAYAWVANDATSSDHVTLSDDTALEPNFTAGADGTYSFTLTVTDPAGNSASQVFSFTYTAPTAPSSTSNSVSQTTTRSVTTNSFVSTPPAQTRAQTGAAPVFTNVTAGVPGATPQVLGARSTTPNDGTTDSDAAGNVLGSRLTTPETEVSEAGTCSKLLGICWYYWIPIVAIVVGVVYYSYRRGDNEPFATI